jgi:hypothetical protein
MTIPRDLSNLAPGVNTSGVLGVTKGGTGAATLTGYVKGAGTTALTASATVPTSDLTGTLAVANGGTGLTTLTANNVILGNGTNAVQFVAPSTNGNVLTSNGTTWTSAAPAATLSGQTNSATPFETSLGYQAGNVNTGTYNTFVGYNAGLSNSTGGNNVAIGGNCFNSNTTGSSNIAVGRNTLSNNSTAISNIAIGTSALTGSNADDNIAIGISSLTSNSTGINNCALGNYSLFFSNGSNNFAAGYQAGRAVTTGSENTLIGTASAFSGTNNLTTGSNNIIIGYNAEASSASVSNEVTIGNTSITSTRLRGMVELNAAMFEKATISATAATGTVNYDARSQSVLYYTSNASGNWTLNIRAASGVSLDSVMTAGESMTVAFLVTNGGTAYYQSAFQVDGVSVTPKWQGGTAPTSGNASSIDVYVITVIKTGAATFTALASQTKFA